MLNLHKVTRVNISENILLSVYYLNSHQRLSRFRLRTLPNEQVQLEYFHTSYGWEPCYEVHQYWAPRGRLQLVHDNTTLTEHMERLQAMFETPVDA